jgi:hypothetical protein
MTIVDGITIKSGGLQVTNGITVSNGGLLVTGGLTVNQGGLVIQGGLTVYGDTHLQYQATYDIAYTSDRRLKTNIIPLRNSLAKISKLRAVHFNWIANESRTQFDKRRHLGLIAQDVQQIVPELVSAIDEKYLGVNYMELIPMLIEAIRELDDRTLSRFKALTNDSESIELNSNSFKKVEEMKSDIKKSHQLESNNVKQNVTKIECADLILIVEDMKNRIAALDNMKVEILSKLKS